MLRLAKPFRVPTHADALPGRAEPLELPPTWTLPRVYVAAVGYFDRWALSVPFLKFVAKGREWFSAVPRRVFDYFEAIRGSFHSRRW